MISLKQSRYLAIPSVGAAPMMYIVKSGGVEVYACTPKGSAYYHKVFLASLAPGEAFFAPVEILYPLEFQIFALSDAELDFTDAHEPQGGFLADHAGDWFHKLAELQWVRYLVGLNDEIVSKWDSRTIFDDARDVPEILEKLSDNLEIMSILITGQFKSREASVEVKTEQRDKHDGRAAAAAMSHLLKTERGIPGGVMSGAGDPVKFAVIAVARHFGMETEDIAIPEDSAERMDPLTKMRRLIKKAGMQTRLVTLPDDWHRSDCGAMLAYRREDGGGDGLVALLPRGGKSYVMVSEEHPLGIRIDDGAASKIGRDAFMCYAGFPSRKLDGHDIWKFMLRHVMRHDRNMVFAMSVIAGLLPLMLPLITETIFSEVIPIDDRRALGAVTQVMLVSGLMTAIVAFVRSISLLRIKTTAGDAFASAVWSRLLSLPAAFFRRYDAGNLVGRMRGVTKITDLIGDSVMSSIFNMLFSFWSLLLMFYYSVKLTMLAVAVWCGYILVNFFLCRKTILTGRREAEASNRSSAQTLQILNGLSKFRLQGGEASAFELWARAFGEEWGWKLKTKWYSNYTFIVNAATPTILSMLIFYMTLGMTESGSGAMDSAKFMAFQAAFSGFNATLVAFMPVVITLFTSIPYVENIMPILETEPEVTDDKAEAGELSGEIEIQNLYFAYSPDSPMILKGISLHVKTGESLAFVGASGCGKSTLLRILLGFEKPTQGAVFYDAQDFSTLSAASVRSQMGVVLQNGQILSGDIFTNIVGSAPLSQEDAWEAARMVGLDKDIENMPMGMHTVISEGAGNISGGQRQRILLARSIVSKPKIIILDEATSALDNATQAIVTESMSRLKATKIIVAHRLSTIKNADRICVLQEGRVAEEGSYDELMKLDGLFARLARRQIAGE
ncbi:MAG: NHLP bacteriocin export ABC transporter permease/ATPase subunit [Synergistaceae bacterium]|jgi:ATP-binding cassette subfamily C protein|nr:NHLP bacteriocin export ABC transporter permease/ATPase subunit [Synergistaceae bacterium]